MAVRTWANTLGVGAGAGLLAGAGQLGIGYGLGILRWDRDFPTSDPWHAQLTWVAFLSGVAVIAGAYAGAWYAHRTRLEPTLPSRIALAFAAAAGAAIILPLTIRPAGLAHPAEGGDPRLSVALTAVAGLLIGVIAAFAALSVPAVSGSVVATVLWIWVVALISAAYTLGGGASWATARLGLFPARGIWVPLALFAPAVLIGLAVAAIARFGGSDSRAVGASGATGPAVVGLAYLIAGPGSGSGGSAYRWALVAIAAGGAVSVLVAVVRRPKSAPTPAPTPAAEAPPPVAPVSPAPVSPAPAPAEADETVDLGRSHPLEGVETSKISEPPPPPPEEERAAEAQAEPEPAQPEPEPAQPVKPAKRFRLGRRKPKEEVPDQPAPTPAAPDDHLDWVKALRSDGTPARVGGNGPARHAKPAEEKKPEESEP